MKSFFKKILTDKPFVVQNKEAEIGNAQLYNLLFSGKITLKEYIKARL
jgi:hypothetical protein